MLAHHSELLVTFSAILKTSVGWFRRGIAPHGLGQGGVDIVLVFVFIVTTLLPLFLRLPFSFSICFQFRFGCLRELTFFIGGFFLRRCI